MFEAGKKKESERVLTFYYDIWKFEIFFRLDSLICSIPSLFMPIYQQGADGPNFIFVDPTRTAEN